MPLIVWVLVTPLGILRPEAQEPEPTDNTTVWDTAETAEKAEAEAALPAPKVVSAVSLPQPADPVPAEPRFKGKGLLAATATLSAAALGVTVARNVVLRRDCPLNSGQAAAKCEYDLGAQLGLFLTQLPLNLAVVGLAPAAGAVMGKYHAWRAATGNGPPRKPGTFVAAGTGVLVAGIAGVGTSGLLSLVLSSRCVNKERQSSDPHSGDRCLRKAFPAWTMLSWVSFAMIGAGGAMLAYGSRYKQWSNRYGKTVVLTPHAGPTHAGLGLSGSF